MAQEGPKFRVYIAQSLDGYIAPPDGSLAWLDPFPAEDCGYQAFIDGVEAIVLGRKTYEQVVTFGEWAYPSKKTFVLTSKPILKPPPGVLPWQNGVEELAVHLRRTVKQGAVWLDGGAQVIQSFQRLGLVDEWEIFVIPVLLGSGIPLFTQGAPPQGLRLVDCKAYPGEIVGLKYEVVPPPQES